MANLFISDLDGTLADQMHRRHLLEAGDWAGYFDACLDDSPINPVLATVTQLLRSGNELWIFSGRSASVRDLTLRWLKWNLPHFFLQENWEAKLVMREVGDTRADDVVKQEMLDSMLIEDRKRLVAVFDDRQRVVDMWRRNGIQCFQVAPGDF